MSVTRRTLLGASLTAAAAGVVALWESRGNDNPLTPVPITPTPASEPFVSRAVADERRMIALLEHATHVRPELAAGLAPVVTRHVAHLAALGIRPPRARAGAAALLDTPAPVTVPASPSTLPTPTVTASSAPTHAPTMTASPTATRPPTPTVRAAPSPTPGHPTVVPPPATSATPTGPSATSVLRSLAAEERRIGVRRRKDVLSADRALAATLASLAAGCDANAEILSVAT